MRPAGRDNDNPFARLNAITAVSDAGRFIRGIGNALMPAIQKWAGDKASKTPVAVASNEPAPKKPGEGTQVDVTGR